MSPGARPATAPDFMENFAKDCAAGASLVKWLNGSMLDGGKISKDDLSIISTADTPEQIVEIIVDAHESRPPDVPYHSLNKGEGWK